MSRCDGREPAGRFRVLGGVAVLIGMIALGTVALIVASVGAMIGLGIGVAIMPWLMPLLWLLFRRKRTRDEMPGTKLGRASVPERNGDRLPRSGRGPLPAH